MSDFDAAALRALAAEHDLDVVRAGSWLGAYDKHRAIAIVSPDKARSFKPLLRFIEPAELPVGIVSGDQIQRGIGTPASLTMACGVCKGTGRDTCETCLGRGTWEHECAQCNHRHSGTCVSCRGAGLRQCGCRAGWRPIPMPGRGIRIAGETFDRLLLSPLVTHLPAGDVQVTMAERAIVLATPTVRVVCMCTTAKDGVTARLRLRPVPVAA